VVVVVVSNNPTSDQINKKQPPPRPPFLVLWQSKAMAGAPSPCVPVSDELAVALGAFLQARGLSKVIN
jgi:hypothetical protein